MAEALAAARADGSGWRCPCCLGLCNCSAVSCQRKLCGLRDTGQLEHEARQFGFRSVAHYLVLTQLDPLLPLPPPVPAVGGGGSAGR